MQISNKYTYEKLIVISPKSFDELRKIIEDRYKKLGPGTKQDPINFNDIDVSNLNSFCHKDIGIFEKTKFEYIDISYWNVSNVKSMRYMFFKCKKLKSIGDVSKWNISKVADMLAMFYGCEKFNQDLSNWDVSNVTNMYCMFYGCKSFNQDLSKWNISNVINMLYMFDKCPIEDKYKSKFK